MRAVGLVTNSGDTTKSLFQLPSPETSKGIAIRLTIVKGTAHHFHPFPSLHVFRAPPKKKKATVV
jgi:hypothetical protein